MITAESLEYIANQSTEHDGNLQRAISTATLNGELPIVALPNGVTIHDLEGYMPAPARFRGSFSTNYIEEFKTYLNDSGSASIFVNADAMQAKAIFDIGTIHKPGHREHISVLNLEKTIPYVAMLQALGNTFNQRELAEWLEQWRDYLEPVGELDIDGKNRKFEGGIARSIAAVRTIDIKETVSRGSVVENFRAEKSMLESVEVSSKLEMPFGFIFSCRPYSDLFKRWFVLRLSITNSEPPKLRLRAMDYEIQKEEMAKEFAALIIDKKRESDKVYIGTFA